MRKTFGITAAMPDTRFGVVVYTSLVWACRGKEC